MIIFIVILNLHPHWKVISSKVITPSIIFRQTVECQERRCIHRKPILSDTDPYDVRNTTMEDTVSDQFTWSQPRYILLYA